ncbi:MAG: electron transfer flavoprotein subunit alpha/FixB family protein, partial [Desulfamplus sp.]|nr:electron transfer flavoprotein subunit alpha/FixB family protein [Desulfamplus sp.]
VIFNPIIWSDALVQAVTAYEISTLFALATPLGKEILPRIAAILDAPLVMECLDVKSEDEHHIAKASLYSGKTVATIKVTGDIRLFGIRPNVLEGVLKEDLASEIPLVIPVEPFNAKCNPRSDIRLVESRAGDLSNNDLLAAEIIISGGRAMKNGENFRLLHDCAEALGNLGAATAVGASRVAVDLGWVPYRMQVGQTGEKVSPKVYIACGISGSVQHFAGMKMSGTIIAINENINAAIMSNCDYFVEADLFEVVPELTEELKKLKDKSSKK